MAMHRMVMENKGYFHIQYLNGEPIQTLYTILGKSYAYGGSLGQNKPLHSNSANIL